jgi:hypothetical protein
MILGRQHGVEQHHRDLRQPDRPVLLAGPIVRAGQHLGLQGGGAGVVAVPGDAGDPLVAHLQADEPGLAASPAAAQVDLPRPAGAPVLPRGARRGPRLDVLEASQRPRQIGPACAHTGHQQLRRGVQVRRPSRLHAREARQLERRVDGEREQQDSEQGGGAQPQHPKPTSGEQGPEPPHAPLCPPGRSPRPQEEFSTQPLGKFHAYRPRRPR